MCLMRPPPEGSELLKKLLDVDISAKQLQKVSEYIGSKLEEEAAEEEKEEHKKTQSEASQQFYSYVQMDGSMLLTREDKWKEWLPTGIKLGRLFQISIKEAARGLYQEAP